MVCWTHTVALGTSHSQGVSAGPGSSVAQGAVPPHRPDAASNGQHSEGLVSPSPQASKATCHGPMGRDHPAAPKGPSDVPPLMPSANLPRRVEDIPGSANLAAGLPSLPQAGLSTTPPLPAGRPAPALLTHSETSKKDGQPSGTQGIPATQKVTSGQANGMNPTHATVSNGTPPAPRDGPSHISGEELRLIVTDMAHIARVQDARLALLNDLSTATRIMEERFFVLDHIVRQERANFRRMRIYIDHVNADMRQEWRDEEVWNKACRLRNEVGAYFEVGTDDEEE